MNNLAWHIKDLSQRHPEKKALLIRNRQGSYDTMTFQELDARSDQLAWGLSNAGMRPGMKVIFMAKPSLELYSLYFAVLKLGAVPVILPQWRGWDYALTCIMQCAPNAFIGTPSTFLMKIFFGRAFCTANVNIMIGKFQLFGGIPSMKLKYRQDSYPIHDFGADEMATLLFTAGSTGVPKGAILTNNMLEQRMDSIQRIFPKQNESPDMSSDVLYTLMELCLGRTVVAENGDATAFFDSINTAQPEYAFANTTLWYEIADLCRQRLSRLSGLGKAVILAPPAASSLGNALALHALAPQAGAMQTYATAETGLVSAIDCRDMLELSHSKENLGKGLCLGRPLDKCGLAIINGTQAQVTPQEEPGEITIAKAGEAAIYLNRPQENSTNAINHEGKTRIRTGDLGFLDKDGMLWYLGRMDNTVETASGKILYSACCEEIANAFPGVKQSMLVGVGDKPNQIPVLIVEPEASEYERLLGNRESLARHISAFPQTSDIKYLLFKHEIRGDVQQNTQWAAERI